MTDLEIINKLGESPDYKITEIRRDPDMKRLEVRIKFSEFPMNPEAHHVVDKLRDIIELDGYVFYDMSNHFHKVRESDKYDAYYYDDVYDYTRIVFEENLVPGNSKLISSWFDTIIELADKYISNDYNKLDGLMQIRAEAKAAKDYVDAFGLK